MTADVADPCCFANDRYEGICTVIPGEGESCGSILDYLNNPMSVGKPYCGRTSIRGGWTQVECTTKTSSLRGGAGSKPAAERPAPAPPQGPAREASAGAR